jgi:hypothetical protein
MGTFKEVMAETFRKMTTKELEKLWKAAFGNSAQEIPEYLAEILIDVLKSRGVDMLKFCQETDTLVGFLSQYSTDRHGRNSLSTPEEERFNNPWAWLAVSKLVHAHQDLFGPCLQAVVVFGDLAAERFTTDIWVVEVIDGEPDLKGQGPQAKVFPTSEHLRLRGHLYYFSLSPEDFERLTAEGHPLMREIAAEYRAVLERDPGYVSDVLSGAQRRRVLLQAVGAA